MTWTERQEEALAVEKSICVTASAGTGKTTLLAERYVRSLLAEKILPKNILCLTYTDKAAVEMRDKIEANLRKKYEEEKDEHVKEAIDTFYQSHISTFHGFCARLLKEFALEAGVTPGFSIMDEVAYGELTDSTLNPLLESPPDELYDNLVFLLSHNGKDQVEKTIRNILGKWRILEDWYQKFSENPEAAYNELVEQFKENIEQQIEKLLADERFASFLDACSQCGYKGSTRVMKAVKFFNALKTAESFQEKLEALKSLKEYKLSRENMEAAHLQDPPLWERNYYNSCIEKIAVTDILPFNHEKIVYLTKVTDCYASIVHEVYARIEDKKKRRGLLAFDDLICATRSLMDNPSVVRQLKERFRFILVDEVQDNDPALTAIIETLRGDHERDNRLFIVGDLKQSIYKFRGADPEGAREYFNTFRHSVDLDICFRSLSPIIDTVNTVFSPLFDGSKPGLSYAGVKCKRDADHGSVQVIHYERAQKKMEKQDYAYEAEQLAGWIQHTVASKEVLVGNDAHPVTYKDIVILQDRGTHLKYLAEALDTYGVPYRVVKGKEFYASEEVRDFIHLLKAIVYKEDDISLYGALTSPYFCIPASDIALYPVASSYDKSSLYDRLSASANPEIAAAIAMLNEFREYQSSASLLALVHYIVQRTGILSVYATMKIGSERISNLNTLLDFISEFSDSIFALIERIEKNVEAAAKDEEGDDEIPEKDANFVSIMTVHASKGLEFPMVILSYAERKMKEESGGITADSKLGLGIFLKGEDKKKIPSYAYTMKKTELDAGIKEERERLFYVAMTRARDHLIISESGFGNDYLETSFMSYYRNAIDVKSDADTTLVNEILGNPVDSRYCLYVPQGWESRLPVVYETEERKINASQNLLDKGSCVHKIFEGADVKETCKLYGFPEMEDEFRTKYNHFMHSAMMKDVVESHCELQITTSSSENKRIDRLVKKSNGEYLIIDYKYGLSYEQPDYLLEKYQKQLTEYAETMEKLLGNKIPAWLYFIEDEKYVQIC